MTRIISTLFLALLTTLTPAASAAPPELSADAPARHVVLPKDTLWSIAGRFLKEPWRWPELWRMNREQIANPHRIYPGDVLVLERDANGQPLLRLSQEQVSPKAYSAPLHQAISSIPANVVEFFTSEPLIVDINGLADAPRIIASGQDRVMMGNGDTAYVLNADLYEDVKTWQIYRPGKPLRDPENGEILGYEAFYLGTAKQLQATEPGEPAPFQILTVKQEIGQGDRLIPQESQRPFQYVPRAPAHLVEARIASVYGGVAEGGRHSLVTLNRGTRDGLEVGHVLAISRNRSVRHHNPETGKTERYTLPDERYGTVFVFRTFERVSYALVMDAKGTVAINDLIRTPQ